jgi:hypothetical protein
MELHDIMRGETTFLEGHIIIDVLTLEEVALEWKLIVRGCRDENIQTT